MTQVVESFDLADVVDRATSRVRLRAPRSVFDVATLPWWVVGESGALERAVTNLLDNAAKWGPSGGTITVRLANGVLTVDDEGPGIDPADLPHVFERFYRSRESRSMPGSGLGLAIVHQVVERHRGTVTAGAAPSGGTRLTMWLPGHPAPVTTPRAPVLQPLVPRSPRVPLPGPTPAGGEPPRRAT
jgi:two-component system sensor histidine kinase MprB